MNREQIKEMIKAQIPCTEYLERSKNNMYCCPYCESGMHGGRDSDGAVKYYEETNTFYCHACGTGGDVIDAYRAQTNSDYNTALSYLAEQIGINIDDSTAQKPQRAAESNFNSEKVKSLNDNTKGAENEQEPPADYTEYYKECAGRLQDPAAISYLEARGIRAATAAAFNIGFDPAADPANVPGAIGDQFKPHPTPRIIAPCTRDFYIARSIDPVTPANYKSPNPKGSERKMFNSAALYKGKKPIFICEGLFDALSFLEAGNEAIALNSRGNGKLLLEQLKEKPTKADFVIVQDDDSDPKTAEQTKAAAEALNRDLQAAGYKSIICNFAAAFKAGNPEQKGKQIKDANDVFITNRAVFEMQIDKAIYELRRDELTAFLEKVQTEAYRPYKTRINFFDELLGGGIIRQTLTLLLAAPAAGKTTLAQQIGETIAENGKDVIYFNFEMSSEQMLAKAMSALYFKRKEGAEGMSALDLLQGYKWTKSQRIEIGKVINEYREKRYPHIKYNPAGVGSEVNEVLDYLNKAGEAAREKGEPAPAAIIDYLHLLRSNEGLETQDLLKKAVEGLKKYAIEYDTFVIGIVATNRDSNKKGKLTMESGRDSSTLEYTADFQITLNYLDIDNGKVKPDDTEERGKLEKARRRAMILRVVKSRFSQQGKSVNVMFDAPHNYFYAPGDDFIPPAGFMTDDNIPAF